MQERRAGNIHRRQQNPTERILRHAVVTKIPRADVKDMTGTRVDDELRAVERICRDITELMERADKAIENFTAEINKQKPIDPEDILPREY